jgi:hypothetical protein
MHSENKLPEDILGTCGDALLDNEEVCTSNEQCSSTLCAVMKYEAGSKCMVPNLPTGSDQGTGSVGACLSDDQCVSGLCASDPLLSDSPNRNGWCSTPDLVVGAECNFSEQCKEGGNDIVVCETDTSTQRKVCSLVGVTDPVPPPEYIT